MVIVFLLSNHFERIVAAPGCIHLKRNCNRQLHWCTQAHNREAIVLLYSVVENMIATLESTTKAVLFGYGLKKHSWTEGAASLSGLTGGGK